MQTSTAWVQFTCEWLKNSPKIPITTDANTYDGWTYLMMLCLNHHFAERLAS
jgi:hypothetical protein